MTYRMATPADLPQIQAVFGRIVTDLRRQNIFIWDEIYPNDWFAGDIAAGQLYVLCEAGAPVCAFALLDGIANKETPAWAEPAAPALYLYRLGVDPAHGRSGVGALAVEKAKETAKALGAQYLRLLVVDNNLPALRFYEKLGFTRIPGAYEQDLKGVLLREYGYEIKL